MQFWEGSEITFACFSEHITAYWCSMISWDEEGDTETGLRFFNRSLSSLSSGALGSLQDSNADGIKTPWVSKNAILKIAPFSLSIVPAEKKEMWQSQNFPNIKSVTLQILFQNNYEWLYGLKTLID